MTQTFSANEIINGNGVGTSYLKRIASNTITINSTGGAVVLSSSGYGYVEAGSSIVLIPSNSSNPGFIASQGRW